MLNYQSTSYHDALGVRRLFGLLPAPEFDAWLVAHGWHDGQAALLSKAAIEEQLIRQLDSVFKRIEGNC